jgi:starch-binding outer membrane protein, SusD/RagB family
LQNIVIMKFEKINRYTIYVFATMIISCCSCKKQLIVDAPINTKNEVVIFQTDGTAATALAGIYITMSGRDLWSLCLYPELSADELTPFAGLSKIPIVNAYYTNKLTSTNIENFDYWSILYPVIYKINAAIQGLDKSTTLTPSVKQQLMAEAIFLRAYCYFYLVNLYGKVPLILTTDYEVNRLMTRADTSDIWSQIISDLKIAKQNLSDNYLNGTVSQPSDERLRPTKWAANALLARVYLYTKDYVNAEINATTVIDNTELFNLPALNDVFLNTSKEAIWQLQPVNPGENTLIGKTFIVPPTGFTADHPVHLSQWLTDEFESGDARKDNWTNSITVNGSEYLFPFKYKINEPNLPVTEYTMMLRLAELYLIRAEVRIMQNNIADGIADLNKLRLRARGEATVQVPDPLPALSLTLNKEQALAAVAHERQLELFTEWGDRWLDLKRTGKVEEVMSVITPLKGGQWNNNWAYYPIPLPDIQKNPNLEQNAGYN